MSNFLAIASVTATLRNRLTAEISARVVGADVTTLRPGELAGGTGFGVNLYPVHAAPNPSLRNRDLPTRGAGGVMESWPGTTVDVRYLVTCFGREEQLEPEKLLGIVLTTLHRNAVLTPAEIAAASLTMQSGGPEGTEPTPFAEPVRLSQSLTSVEELQRVWSLFTPMPYRLSVVYEVSAVLLESDDLVPRALPVRRVQPSAVSGAGQSRVRHIDPPQLSYRPDATVRVIGSGFDRDTAVLLDGVAVSGITAVDGGLQFQLPKEAGTGVHQVGVGQTMTLETLERSYVLPSEGTVSLTVLPVLQHARFATVADPRSGTPLRVIQAGITPAAGLDQATFLYLNAASTGGEQRPRDSSGATGVGEWLRSTLRSVAVEAGPASRALRESFAAANLTLSTEATVRPGSGGFAVIDDGGTQNFFVHTTAVPWVVCCGLGSKDLGPGSIAFAVDGVLPGRYLLRVSVAGYESVPEIDEKSGRYSGPVVTIA